MKTNNQTLEKEIRPGCKKISGNTDATSFQIEISFDPGLLLIKEKGLTLNRETRDRLASPTAEQIVGELE